MPFISNFLNSFIFALTDRVFGPDTVTEEVYEVAARPVVKAAMEGINGMLSRLQCNGCLLMIIELQVGDC